MLVVVAIPTTATGAVEEAVEVAEVVDHGQARPFCTGLREVIQMHPQGETPVEVILVHHTRLSRCLFNRLKLNGPTN